MIDPPAVLAQLATRHGIAFRSDRLPTSAHVTRDQGPRLHYLSWPSDGQPVVLLHGGALSAHTWDLVCLALADYRCITPNLRGHGESGWADDYRIDASVEDIIALVDQLRLARFHLVGMSLGGNIAGHTAAVLGERVASLTLVDIAPGVHRNGTQVMRDFLSAAHALPSVEALVDAAHGLSPRTDRATLQYRYHYMTERTDDGWRFRHDQRRRPDFPHIIAKLTQLEGLAERIACPLLLARGARSRVLGEAAAQAFAARFRSGRQVTIDDAGHNVQEDNPRALAAALRAHFEASWPWDDTRSSHSSSR